MINKEDAWFSNLFRQLLCFYWIFIQSFHSSFTTDWSLTERSQQSTTCCVIWFPFLKNLNSPWNHFNCFYKYKSITSEDEDALQSDEIATVLSAPLLKYCDRERAKRKNQCVYLCIFQPEIIGWASLTTILYKSTGSEVKTVLEEELVWQVGALKTWVTAVMSERGALLCPVVETSLIM